MIIILGIGLELFCPLDIWFLKKDFGQSKGCLLTD
jgi:hypothetical protein